MFYLGTSVTDGLVTLKSSDTKLKDAVTGDDVRDTSSTGNLYRVGILLL